MKTKVGKNFFRHVDNVKHEYQALILASKMIELRKEVGVVRKAVFQGAFINDVDPLLYFHWNWLVLHITITFCN